MPEEEPRRISRPRKRGWFERLVRGKAKPKPAVFKSAQEGGVQKKKSPQRKKSTQSGGMLGDTVKKMRSRRQKMDDMMRDLDI